jgi:hypothetical protein
MRIHAGVLGTDSTGRSTLGDAIFSGLAYVVDGEGNVREIRIFEEGMPAGISNDWVDAGGRDRLDRAVLDLADDYGPLVRGETPVDGIVYFFDLTGACILEEAYEGGIPADTARREWYRSGAPKALLDSEGGTAWFEDGRLQAKRVDGQTLLNLVTHDDGRLGAITLYDRALFDPVSIRSMPYSDELLLIGPGFDLATLGTLIDQPGIGAVARLHLIKTELGADCVDRLARLAGLQEVYLTENRLLSPQDAQNLRDRKPGLVVHYEPAG